VLSMLSLPFEEHEIHWRIGSTNKRSVQFKTNDKNAKATKGVPLAYLDARNVMDRLDSVLGAENWQDTYTETPSGRVLCSLMLRINGEWITKTDGAGSTNMEGEKGGLSDAFKRAAVKFGIGRYLYSLPNEWVDIDEYGKPKNDPKLPNSHLPKKRINREEMQASLAALVDGLGNEDSLAVKEVIDELEEAEQFYIWKLLSNKQQMAAKAMLHKENKE